MASGEVRKVSREDIQLVQNLIERCLQLYMSQKEVVDVLLQQAKIEPGFTELVWNRLEVENQEFFRAYHLRLIVKDQILRFNELLERQDQLMHQICSSEFASIAISDGSQIPSVPQNTVSHSPEHIESPVKMESVDQDFNTNLHNAYIGVSSLQPCTPAMDLTSHARRIEAPANITFAQNSNVGMIQGMNVEMLKPEGVYTGNNAVVISADVNGLDTHPAIENAPIASYNGIMPKSQTLNQTFLDLETPAFGSLGQIPRNFSLSDLTADFSSSNEILESFSRSIFVASDHDGREGLQGQHHDNFMDPHGREGLRGQHHDNFMDPHGREGLRGQHHDMKHHDNFMDPHGREGLRGQHRDNFMDPNLRGGRQGQHDDNFMDRHRR